MKLTDLYESTGVTLKKVNDELKKRGIAAELVKGKGYHYFTGDDCSGWPETSVMVYNVNELTLDQWMTEWETLKEQAE